MVLTYIYFRILKFPFFIISPEEYPHYCWLVSPHQGRWRHSQQLEGCDGLIHIRCTVVQPVASHTHRKKHGNSSRNSPSIPIGSMVLLYMVLHGSHQYTPFMLAYIPAPWILWDWNCFGFTCFYIILCLVDRAPCCAVFSFNLHSTSVTVEDTVGGA